MNKNHHGTTTPHTSMLHSSPQAMLHFTIRGDLTYPSPLPVSSPSLACSDGAAFRSAAALASASASSFASASAFRRARSRSLGATTRDPRLYTTSTPSPPVSWFPSVGPYGVPASSRCCSTAT
eukprot:scaffold16534_cov55-Phaeocystis_antarctica.AAC.3